MEGGRDSDGTTLSGVGKQERLYEWSLSTDGLVGSDLTMLLKN